MAVTYGLLKMVVCSVLTLANRPRMFPGRQRKSRTIMHPVAHNVVHTSRHQDRFPPLPSRFPERITH